jgi:hypothetical protein
MSRQKSLILGAICMAALLGAGVKLTLDLQSFMDLDFRDETFYLTNGVRLATGGVPSPENAPMYAVWYFLLSLIRHDPLKLYYLNYKIITVTIPLLAYLLLRRLDTSRPVSLLASAYLLISFANLASYSKSAHFSLLIVLPAFIVSTYFKSFRASTLCLATGILLASYVRPELFLAYLLLAIIYLWATARDLKRLTAGRELPSLVLLVGAPLLLIALFGVPVLGGQGRSFLAFRQFFSVNWTQWEKSGLEPWSHYAQITSLQFGPVESVWQAFVAKPGLFLKHVGYNVIRAPASFGESLFMHYNVLLPLTSRAYWVAEAVGLLAAGMGYLLYQRRRSWEAIRTGISRDRRLVLQAAVCCLPGIASSAIFLPKRYLLILSVVFAIVFLAAWLFRDLGRSWGAGRLLLAGAGIVALTPCICQLGDAGRAAFGGDMVNERTIKFIRSLDVDHDIVLLSAEGRPNVYFGDRCAAIRGGEKEGGFSSFVRDRGINMILETRSLKRLDSFAEDPEWEAFCDDPGALGFEEFDVPGTARKLFVKRDMLSTR